jgi:hypothetical protein
VKEYGTSHVCVDTSQHFHTCGETESVLQGVPTYETESLLHGVPTYETESVLLVMGPLVVQVSVFLTLPLPWVQTFSLAPSSHPPSHSYVTLTCHQVSQSCKIAGNIVGLLLLCSLEIVLFAEWELAPQGCSSGN